MHTCLHINLQKNGGILAVSDVIISITLEDELVLCLVFTTNPENKQARLCSVYSMNCLHLKATGWS